MNKPTIQSVTPTICELFGVTTPADCQEKALPTVIEAVKASMGALYLDRLLVYAPDAIGTHFLRKYPEIYQLFHNMATVEIELQSVFPPKTPVCFASMFSGVLPAKHGIQAYTRPVLAIDTVFDAMARQEKKCAIVAVAQSSIDLIFRNRDMEYYTEEYDPQVTIRTLDLIGRDHHDLIVAYHQEYDDTLHKTTPFSDEAIDAARRHGETFQQLLKAAAIAWKGRRWAVAVTPDHGAHIQADGLGTHGDDIPEDMEVTHFWNCWLQGEEK